MRFGAATVKYHYLYRLFTYSMRRIEGETRVSLCVLGLKEGRAFGCVRPLRVGDVRQVGSLAGAAHPLNDNAGVPRGTHRGQKPRVEQKGKCPLDLDFQCEYEP